MEFLSLFWNFLHRPGWYQIQRSTSSTRVLGLKVCDITTQLHTLVFLFFVFLRHYLYWPGTHNLSRLAGKQFPGFQLSSLPTAAMTGAHHHTTPSHQLLHRFWGTNSSAEQALNWLSHLLSPDGKIPKVPSSRNTSLWRENSEGLSSLSLRKILLTKILFLWERPTILWKPYPLISAEGLHSK